MDRMKIRIKQAFLRFQHLEAFTHPAPCNNMDDAEDIMLTGKSQSQKIKYVLCVLSHSVVSNSATP